jgi:hypothetical protein
MYHADKNVIVQAEPDIIGKGTLYHTNTIFEEGCDGMVMDKNPVAVSSAVSLSCKLKPAGSILRYDRVTNRVGVDQVLGYGWGRVPGVRWR